MPCARRWRDHAKAQRADKGFVMGTATAEQLKSIQTFAEFYPIYLGEHQDLTCRRMHFVGSTLSLVCLLALIVTGNPWFLLAGLLCGYGFAWIGHFVFEKNRPASFSRPLYSFMGDWVMYKDIWTGRIKF
jgi:hypothetical protein